MSDSKEENSSTVVPFFRQCLCVSGVVLYMIGTGALIAFPGVLFQQLAKEDSSIHLEGSQHSWIASSIGLALMVGISTSPVIQQRFGRKTTNQLASIPTLSGWMVMMLATNFEMLIGSRILQGFGMGMHASVAPVSIAEYSSPKYRGAFLATIAFSFGTGMLIAHLYGTFLFWRYACIACSSVYILSFICVSLSPETPPWLASKGHYERCKKSFRWLRGVNPESEKELAVLLESQRKSRSQNDVNFKFYLNGFKKPEFYKPAVIMILMFILFQVSLMTVVPSYSTLIVSAYDIGVPAPYCVIIVSSVRFVSSILACVIVYKFERRHVLFYCTSLCTFFLVLTSVLMYLTDWGYIENGDFYSFASFLCFIVFKTLGILPIPWAVAGEIFPLAYRSLGSGISGLVLAFMFFLVNLTAPQVFEALELKGAYLMYSCFIVLCSLGLFFLLPETKGKTLYEIECHFKGINEDTIVPNEKDKMINNVE